MAKNQCEHCGYDQQVYLHNDGGRRPVYRCYDTVACWRRIIAANIAAVEAHEKAEAHNG